MNTRSRQLILAQLLPTLFLFSVCLSQAQAASSDFVKGLALYGTGKGSAAFPLFEQVFADPTSPKEYRSQSAFILAFAPNSGLQKKKRHYYAAYTLENHPSLDAKNRVAFLRISGDGFFDEMKLESAQRYYNLLAADTDLKNRAYAQYRLGWIEINQQNPQLSLNRWSEFLIQSGSPLLQQDPELMRSIVRDLGKVWVETSETHSPPPLSPTLIQTLEPQSAEFSEGIALGLKRMGQVEVIERFRSTLYQTPFAPLVLSQLLKRGFVFSLFPCDLSKWVASSEKLSATDQTAALPVLNQCAKTITEKKLCETPQGTNFQTFFDSFSLQGDALLPRISLSVECKDWKKSCRDLTQLALFQIESNPTVAQPIKSETESALYETCAQGVINPAETALQKSLLNLITQAVKRNAYPLEATRPLAQLVELSLSHTNFLQGVLQLLANSELTPLFHKTPLPERAAHYLPQLSPEMSLSEGQRLLSLYAHAPVQGVWLQLLKLQLNHQLERKDYAAVQLLLETYLPLVEDKEGKPFGEETTQLWEAFWLTIEANLFAAQEARLDLWLKQMPWKNLTTERRQRVFSILLKYDRLAAIWMNWNQFEGNFKSFNSSLTALFYEQSLANIQTGKLDAKLLETSSSGKTLTRMAKNDTSLTVGQIKNVLGTSAPAFPVAYDVEVITQLKALSKKSHKESLKLTPALTRILGNKLKTLQKSENLLSSTAWVTPETQKSAQTVFTQDCTDLIAELEKLEKELAKEPELAEVLEQMSQIKAQVQEKIPTTPAVGSESPTPTPTPTTTIKGKGEKS